MVNRRDIQAEVTREKILEVAGEEMIRHGYQTASTTEILNRLGISKGALYHHFASKKDLGYAVLDECFTKHHAAMWDQALEAQNPLAAVVQLIDEACKAMVGERLKCGCPINNLAQEMSPLDEGFRSRIEKVYSRWERRMTEAFLRAQREGYMHDDVDASEASAFVIATTQGAIGLAKNAQATDVFRRSVRGLIRYLQGLAKEAA